MNPVPHIDHPQQASGRSGGFNAWDDFERAPGRRTAAARPVARTKARVRHAHLSFTQTPALYLREEMV